MNSEATSRLVGELTGHDLRAFRMDRLAAWRARAEGQVGTVADGMSADARARVLAAQSARVLADGERARAALTVAESAEFKARARVLADARARKAASRRKARSSRGSGTAGGHGRGDGSSVVKVRALRLDRLGRLAVRPVVSQSDHKLTVADVGGLPRLVGDVFVRDGAERGRYSAFWHAQDGALLSSTARRLARSVRGGKVSDTSRDEAAAAARAALVVESDRLASSGLHWSSAVRLACSDDVSCRAAVAAARSSLRGEVLGGVTARNGAVEGRALASDDGNGGLVWSLARGEWVKVRRADGAQAVDQAGRMICDLRGEVGDDQASDAWARDAVRLVGWLASRRLSVRGNWSNACRARVRASAARVARVLRRMARGESIALACAAVGWQWNADRNCCRAWADAVSALTDGRGLADACRDWRASV